MKNRHLIIPIASMVAVSLAMQFGRAETSANSQASGPIVSAPFDAPAQPGAKPSASSTAAVTASAHTMPYTVVAHDTLTKLAVKFNTTRKKLEDLNNLAGAKLTPGQIILVPATKKSLAAATAKAKKKYAAAQPVQDFDIPASTFASCPVPPSNGDDSEVEPDNGKPAPVAQLVSPSEMSADEAKRRAAEAASAPAPAVTDDGRLTASITPPRLSLPPEALKPAPVKLAPVPKLAATVPAKQTPAMKPAPTGWANDSAHRSTTTTSSSSFSRFFSNLSSPHLSSDVSMNSPANDPGNEWGYKFTRAARELGDRGIDYDDDWRPPGERSAWTMDCSNTSRWLYKAVANINLPRTASDQYYYLHLQGKAWDVPTGATGWADVQYLQRNLKPGDLLFWENTYKPERSPPITHVMVYLGTNDKGQWIMAGSQSSRGGEHNRSNGGPDVYVFRPSQPCGGYSTWFGMKRHVGRFCAFGRPLEADPSKFALN